MRLYEFEAKALAAKNGIPVSVGQLLRSRADQVEFDSPSESGWVVKSQVLTGGRMKAGGIGFAQTLEGLRKEIERVWTHPLRGSLPVAVLVEPRMPVSSEYYVGVTFDQSSRQPMFIFSTAGGIDVESGNGKVARGLLPVQGPVCDFHVRDVLIEAGVPSADLPALTRISLALVRLFDKYDLVLAELNPLAQLTDGQFLALDAHVELDEDALHRQRAALEQLGITDLGRQVRPPTELERQAQKIDAEDHRGVAGRVIEFDGDLGLIIGGGGASLAAFDAVRRHDGRPANYCEIGGNPSVRKVTNLTRLLLGKPGVEKVAVIMNVVNNTRADLVARGVIKGIVEAGRRPDQALAVFRVPGAGETESIHVLRAWGVEPCGREISIEDAASRAIADMHRPKGRA